MATPEPPVGIDPTRPHVARVYDYQLGGVHNFAADRELADQILAIVPEAIEVSRANRAFLQRAVRFLAAEAGIRQFIDIGTGLPTQGNVHEVAQEVCADARVIYVDNDPIVLAHSRALLDGNDQAAAILADFCEPEAILVDPDVRALVDLDRPAAIIMCGLLHWITDDNDPYGSVAYLRDALAPGSYVALSHACDDHRNSEAVAAEVREIYSRATSPIVGREWPDIARFFDGMDLIEPGMVWAPQWRPGLAGAGPDPGRTHIAVGVARKA